MKAIACVFLFFITQSALFAADTTTYSCKYRFIKQIDPKNLKSKFDDVMILTISKSRSTYYSYLKHYGNRLKQADQEKITNENNQAGIVSIDGNSNTVGKYFTLNESEIIEIDFIRKNVSFTDQLINTQYGYNEPLERPRWKIENESKVILNQQCQKATTFFKGRNYIAWFTTSIPYQMGPWLLNGLPGLIIRVNSDDNQFEFECIELNTNVSSTKVFKKYANVTIVSKSKLKAKKKLLSQNPIEYMVSELGKTITSSGGANVKMPDKPYNPIDLTK